MNRNIAIQALLVAASLTLLLLNPESKCYWMLVGWSSAFLVSAVITDHKEKEFVRYLESELQSVTDHKDSSEAFS